MATKARGRRSEAKLAPAAAARKSEHLYPVCGLVAATQTAYATSFRDGFALDGSSLLRDPRIQAFSGQNLHDILWHTYWWPTGEAGLYRPLTTLSLLFNYVIFGSGAASFHWVNWLLHAANVLLVYALVFRLTRVRLTAVCVAGLWAVHPVLTEAVTNVAGRSDLLGGMAVLGGLLLYLGAARSRFRLIPLALVAAAGVASKESAAVLPGVILVYELVWWKPERRRLLGEGLLTTAIPIGAVLLLRAAVLRMALPAEFPFVDDPIVAAGFWQAKLTALSVLGRYAGLLIWPATLSSDYSFAQIPLVSGAAVSAGAMFLAPVVARHRIALFFAGFAFLTILPASNLLFPSGTIMAERLLYLPSIGFAVLVVRLIELVPRPAWVVPVLCGLLALAYGVRTTIRNADWQNDHTMAVASVETSPNSFKVHRLMAEELWEADASHANIDRVIAEADRSVAILTPVPDADNSAGAWTLAATAHLAKADATNSAAEYRRAAEVALRSTQIEAAGRAAFNRRHGTSLAAETTAADAYSTLARAELRLEQPEKALAAATQAKTINPARPEVYAEIAQAEVVLGRGEEAAEALIEGMFLTSNTELRQDLIRLYQGGVDTKGCALTAGAQGPAINPGCDVVHRTFCAAATRLHRDDVLTQMACSR